MLAGSLDEERFETPARQPELYERRTRPEGDLSDIGPTVLHRLTPVSARAVSLHVYRPPLRTMGIWDDSGMISVMPSAFDVGRGGPGAGRLGESRDVLAKANTSLECRTSKSETRAERASSSTLLRPHFGPLLPPRRPRRSRRAVLPAGPDPPAARRARGSPAAGDAGRRRRRIVRVEPVAPHRADRQRRVAEARRDLDVPEAIPSRGGPADQRVLSVEPVEGLGPLAARRDQRVARAEGAGDGEHADGERSPRPAATPSARDRRATGARRRRRSPRAWSGRRTGSRSARRPGRRRRSPRAPPPRARAGARTSARAGGPGRARARSPPGSRAGDRAASAPAGRAAGSDPARARARRPCRRPPRRAAAASASANLQRHVVVRRPREVGHGPSLAQQEEGRRERGERDTERRGAQEPGARATPRARPATARTARARRRPATPTGTRARRRRPARPRRRPGPTASTDPR